MTKKEKCELWKKKLSEYYAGLKPIAKDFEEQKQEIKLEDVFNDEKRQGVKELIDKHKQEAALKEALLELRKTPMTFEPEQETLEDIKLEEVFGSGYCQFSVIENKLAILYRNQEQLLKAIKLLSNEKQRNT